MAVEKMKTWRHFEKDTITLAIFHLPTYIPISYSSKLIFFSELKNKYLEYIIELS